MSIKDLFGKTSGKILTSQQVQTLYDDAESELFLEELSKDNQRFLPIVDFSSASNFARYGSAEKYYADAIKNVYQRYPYDGSRKEKLEWRNNSSQFDIYVFDNIYPKTTGYITLNSSSQQYVSVKGGPNTSSTGKFINSNIYDTASNRESNLAVNPLNLGNTVEFWFKETSTNASVYPLFDLWNGNSSGSADYTRFLIEKNTSGFRITYCSGTSGVERAQLVYSVDTGSWHHYSFVVSSASSGLNLTLAVDGQIEKEIVSGSAFSSIANNASTVAYIGAYRTGSGYVNGSFDEFRFWKEARSSKNISRYWFTNVAGGANTDDSNTELGVYFKFNEGIVSTSSINSLDAQCLDYSGRISNGTIVNYSVAVRNTGSAIENYSSEIVETKDPILYPSNSRLIEALDTYTNSGSLYDQENNSNIYKSLPSWISEAQEDANAQDLSNLVQIISSYFDTLHVQIENLPRIKDNKYYGDKDKPAPFTNKLLTSYDFQNLDAFSDTTFLEEVISRNETDEFEKSLIDVKNTIYQNIYNNLTYIYKSKGTEKSIRNFIRCFGVDDELVKINLYSDNAEFEVSEKYQYVATTKKFVDFNDPDRFEGAIYQKSISGDSDTRGYILGDPSLVYVPVTVQAEVIFPKKVSYDNPRYIIPEFTRVSLFGVHTANSNESILTWGSDEFNFQVYAEKRNFESSDVYFRVTGSLGGSGFNLTSSWYNDVYENSKWNLAVRIKPNKLGNVNFVSGSSVGDYTLEFVGFNSILDSVEASFIVTASIAEADAKSAMAKNKRVYAGAHYENFDNSTVLSKTDVKISSVRFWFDYLSDSELRSHSFDASSFGRQYPFWNAHLADSNVNTLMLTKADMLALNWDFSLVTGSNTAGQFVVEDASSGSYNSENTYGLTGILGQAIKYRHTGLGAEFYPSDTQVVNREDIFTAKLQQPESIFGSDLIQIRNTDDVTAKKYRRPITYYYSIEKSMSQVISDEMLKWFATIDAFNNLIGEPADRYRKQYKNLTHLRELFFNKVQNAPDFERFIEFYKWIDSSISTMVMQLIPASANVSTTIKNVVESHLLERNKYENKLPTIEAKDDVVSVTSNFRSYNYNEQIAANNPTGSLWLKNRVERTNPLVTSGDAVADADREVLRQVLTGKNINKIPKQYDEVTNTFYEGKKDFVRGFSNIGSITSSVIDRPEDIISPIDIANKLFSGQFKLAEQTITGSGQIVQPAKKLGNYQRTYEYVQTSGRTDNNKELPDLIENLNNTSSGPANGFKDRVLQSRDAVKAVFVEKFSAPGGPEVSSRGALNKESEEYSAYNNINVRNIVVRKQYNKWLAESSSINSENPSLHKVNKNTGYRYNEDNSLKQVYNNEVITHQIPRSDSQYSWITASLLTKPSSSAFITKYDNLNVYNTSSFSYVSGAISGSATFDFVGLNTNFIKSIDTSSNLISSSVAITGTAVNGYLLNLNGPYQNPTWKQIRAGQNKLAEISRKNNNILAQDISKTKVTTDKNGVFEITTDRVSNSFTAYKEPPVSYNKFIKHSLKPQDSKIPSNTISSYDNNKEKFVNQALIQRLGVKENSEKQFTDTIDEIVTNETFSPKIELLKISKEDFIFPSSYVGLKESRIRPNYEDYLENTGSVINTRTFWRDDINNRARESEIFDMYGISSSYETLLNRKKLVTYNDQTSSGETGYKFGIYQSSSFNNSIFTQDNYKETDYVPTFAADESLYEVGFVSIITEENAFNDTSYSSIKKISPIANGNKLPTRALSLLTASEGLYIGGGFDNVNNTGSADAIVRWNGLDWFALGSGVGASGFVYEMFSGSEGLYVGGTFTNVNGTSSADNIALWNGVDWFALGSGLNTTVNAISSGSEGIYAGGYFTNVNGTASADYIALWNGVDWSSITNAGTFGANTGGFAYIQKILSCSEGVYVGGNIYISSGSILTYGVALWNGTDWKPVTGSNSFSVLSNFNVNDLLSSSEGLYITGERFSYGSQNVVYLWNGSTMLSASSRLQPSISYERVVVNKMVSSSDGLYLFGIFETPELNGLDISIQGVTRWDGQKYNLVGGGYQKYGEVYDAVSSSFGIYVASETANTVNLQKTLKYDKSISGYLKNKTLLEEKYFERNNIFYPIKYVGKYNLEKENIYSIKNDFNSYFETTSSQAYLSEIAVGESGSLYVAGYFDNVTTSSNYSSLAYWSGQSWVALGRNLNSSIYSMLSSSEGLYIGGSFTTIESSPTFNTDRIALWNGSNWRALKTGLNGTVFSMASASSGLYVGGSFQNANGTASADYIARWDGGNWNAVGSGLTLGGIAVAIDSIVSGTDGIYIGGDFDDANGIAAADRIAKWNGSAWVDLSTAGWTGQIRTIISGSDYLYVFGTQGGSIGGGVFAFSAARYNGTSWTDMGITNITYPIGNYPQFYSAVSTSKGIYVCGDFESIGSVIAKNVALWDGTKWNKVGATNKRNGFGVLNGEKVINLALKDDEIYFVGDFTGTRSGPIIKDSKYDFFIEAYVPSGSLVTPTPQLVFNNFIPPSRRINSGSQTIYENTYNSNNQLISTSKYNSNEDIYIFNEGFVYETDKKSNNKPFFDSYEEYLSDVKAKSKNYSLIPEYRISDFMESYVKDANGNFETILTSDILRLNGSLQENGYEDINNSINTSKNLNTEIIFKNANSAEEVEIKFKVSAIKKVLPYRGFYPADRITTLASYFINSFLPINNFLTSTKDSTEIYSSSLSNGTPIQQQMLTLLQPTFAPGILLNTIKASIAVDFPVFITKSVSYDSDVTASFYSSTGSSLITKTAFDIENGQDYNYTASNFIDQAPTFRMPFESIIEFDSLIPNELKTSENNLYYLNPTHYTSDTITGSRETYSTVTYPSYNMGSGSLKSFEFKDNNYKLAIHNFLAEIPNFFMNGKLTNLVSAPEDEFKTTVAGKKYYMDIVLEKDSRYKEMITDPFYEGLKKLPERHADGTFMIPSPDSLYGPPVRFWNTVSASNLFQRGPYSLYGHVLDTPAYAPYVPPYYYGKSIARLSFLAQEDRQYTLSEIQEGLQVEYINTEAEDLFLQRSNFLLNNITSSTILYDNYRSSPAYSEMMKISSSVNMFLKSEVKNTTFDANNSSIDTVQSKENKTFNWAIQTKYETPSINFANADLSENVGLIFVGGDKSVNGTVKGIYKNLFKGLWTSYGQPINQGEGIKLYVQESFQAASNKANSLTGSLIDLCGFRSDDKKTIGLLAAEKNIEEAIVIIPYTFIKNHSNSDSVKYAEYAETIPEIIGENEIIEENLRGNGPYYFKIDRKILTEVIGISFSKDSTATFEEIKSIVNSNKVDENNSIVKLVKEMTKFVIPPHLDWIRNKKIDPFVMYVVPFSIKFDKNDLSDIWQGLMPKQSKLMEIEDKTISHKFSINELFHGKKPTNDIKFKFFKVKQKANVNYYELTADSKDDTRFKFKFGNSREATIPQYSYNYPYDFFSIIELVNVETALTYTPESSGGSDTGENI